MSPATATWFKILSSVAFLAAVGSIAHGGMTGRSSGLVVLAAACAMGALALVLAEESER